MFMKSFNSRVFAALLLCASMLGFKPALAGDASFYSFSGIKRYRDSGGGVYSYYPVSNVPGKDHEMFFFGTYTWSYPAEGNSSSLTFSEDVGYLINCRTTEITKVFSAAHITPKVLLELPPEIAHKVRQAGLTRLVNVKGLETKNYRRHNVLRQAVTHMDTSAFRLTCNYIPEFE